MIESSQNWQDGNIAKSTTVADFRQLATGLTVTISSSTYVGGLVFDGNTGGSWTINASNGSRLVLRTSLFGYAPIYVGGGTLTISPYVIFDELRTVNGKKLDLGERRVLLGAPNEPL